MNKLSAPFRAGNRDRTGDLSFGLYLLSGVRELNSLLFLGKEVYYRCTNPANLRDITELLPHVRIFYIFKTLNAINVEA
jgi:hypothetical protein